MDCYPRFQDPLLSSVKNCFLLEINYIDYLNGLIFSRRRPSLYSRYSDREYRHCIVRDQNSAIGSHLSVCRFNLVEMISRRALANLRLILAFDVSIVFLRDIFSKCIVRRSSLPSAKTRRVVAYR